MTKEKLWVAIKNNDVKGGKDILANYIVDVNAKTKWRSTPLHEDRSKEVA